MVIPNYCLGWDKELRYPSLPLGPDNPCTDKRTGRIIPLPDRLIVEPPPGYEPVDRTGIQVLAGTLLLGAIVWVAHWAYKKYLKK